MNWKISAILFPTIYVCFLVYSSMQHGNYKGHTIKTISEDIEVKDENKTKEQLINELAEMRSYVALLKKSEAECKRVAEALSESEMLFRNLFEQHAAVKLIIDPADGKIIDANAQAVEFYGWTREQLRQMMIQDINILSPEEIMKEMEKARTHKRIHFEFIHKRVDGSIRNVDVYSSKIVTKGRELLYSIIHDITKRKRLEEERGRLIVELQNALAKVKTLSGMLPICASCKKIRDDNGYWNQIESYIMNHSEAEFSHSICPECAKKLYPEYFEEMFPEHDKNKT